eukprot:Lankesteria_metandrocarpae@DN4292_c0_g1_i1.p1
MRFLEDPKLNRLSVLLKNFEAGDQTLSGCIELFTTREKQRGEKKLGEVVSTEVKKNHDWLGKCPLGKLRFGDVKELLTNLLSVLCQCYPDYDFSSLSPENFVKITDFGTVFNNVNSNLSFVVERAMPGFLHELWASVRDAINVEDAEIYSCANPFSDDETCQGFFFDYFLHDRAAEKILFFSCATQSPYTSLSQCPPDSSDEDEDDILDDDDDEDRNDDDDDVDDERISDEDLDIEQQQKSTSTTADGGHARPTSNKKRKYNFNLHCTPTTGEEYSSLNTSEEASSVLLRDVSDDVSTEGDDEIEGGHAFFPTSSRAAAICRAASPSTATVPVHLPSTATTAAAASAASAGYNCNHVVANGTDPAAYKPLLGTVEMKYEESVDAVEEQQNTRTSPNHHRTLKSSDNVLTTSTAHDSCGGVVVALKQDTTAASESLPSPVVKIEGQLRAGEDGHNSNKRRKTAGTTTVGTTVSGSTSVHQQYRRSQTTPPRILVQSPAVSLQILPSYCGHSPYEDLLDSPTITRGGDKIQHAAKGRRGDTACNLVDAGSDKSNCVCISNSDTLLSSDALHYDNSTIVVPASSEDDDSLRQPCHIAPRRTRRRRTRAINRAFGFKGASSYTSTTAYNKSYTTGSNRGWRPKRVTDGINTDDEC